jgi:prophage tail gpP-like protein
VYGSDIHAANIGKANPGVDSSNLIAGSSLSVPALPNYPGDVPRILGIDGTNNVQLYIDGTRFEFWTNLTIKRSIDGIDVVSFMAPFEPFAPGFREMFTPFTYKPITVYIGNTLLLSGRIINTDPKLNQGLNTIKISAYSLPGTLQDCMAPASSFPLEFTGISITDIAKALLTPFGLTVDTPKKESKPFDVVVVKPTDKIIDFLGNLARQRNLVMTSTTDGKLKFWQSSDATNPVSNLETGKTPLVSIEPNFNEQQYYSSVTGVTFAATGVPGEQFTTKNPFLPGVIRPFTFGATDTDGTDISVATNAKAGRMFANMVTYTVEVDTWRTKTGEFWEPNTTVNVKAPEVYIYNEYNFIIRSVEFARDETREMATLEIVLPGGFNGKLPETLPWDL